MYKNLLVATDGSKLSDKAVAHAIALAQSVGAIVHHHPIGGGGRDHGRADVERDLALVVVLNPEELPFGDRDLAAGALVHGPRLRRR